MIRSLCFCVSIVLASMSAFMLSGCRADSEALDCDAANCLLAEYTVACPQQCPYLEGSLAVDWSACPSSVSSDEIARTAAMAIWWRRTLKVLEEAGSRANGLASSTDGAFVTLAQNPEADALSLAFTFDPESGAYKTDLATTDRASLTVGYSFGDDYEVGKKGDPILAYLFRTESYLAGADVELGSFDAKVSFQKEGPLVELLGFGQHPPNPFVLGLLNPTDIHKQSMNLSVVDDDRFPGDIAVHIEARARRVVGLGINGPGNPDKIEAPIELVASSMSRDGGATLVVKDWKMRFVFEPSASQLSGSVHFRIDGGAAPLDGSLVYQGGAPTLFVSCAGP